MVGSTAIAIDIIGLASTGAGFRLALAIHIAAGITGVVSGLLAATARKRRGRQPRAGTVYLYALGVVVATAVLADEDVSLANPLGPARLEWTEVKKTIEEAAAHFQRGSLRVEEVTRCVTPDLGYVIQVERSEVQLAGSEDMVAISLRVTMIFRREGKTWKVAHRHADPITSARPISTAVET